MTYLILGFITGLSLILAIGAQNIFVIEQGLKKQYVFLVCVICSLSDFNNVCDSIKPSHAISVIDPGFEPATCLASLSFLL